MNGRVPQILQIKSNGNEKLKTFTINQTKNKIKTTKSNLNQNTMLRNRSFSCLFAKSNLSGFQTENKVAF